MNETSWQRDLPALRTDDQDLPALLPMSGPQPEPALGTHPHWSNFASQLHVNAIAVHPLDGTIWLATPGGVLRWSADQSTFTRYASEHGLPGNAITHIAIDPSGQLWAASETTLSYLDDHTWQPFLYILEQPIHCTTRTNADAIHVAAGNNLYTLTTPHTMPDVTPLPLGASPRALAATPAQGIWLCNARGLYHWQKDHWHPHLLQPHLLTLAITPQHLWAGTTNGLLCIDLTQNKPCHSTEWPTGPVTALAVAPDKTHLWAACAGKLGLITPTTWQPLNNRPQTNEPITCIAPTHHQTLWFGTPKGLFTADPTHTHKCVTDSPPDIIGLSEHKKPTPTFCNLVQALALQQLATTTLLWIGTASHLYSLDLTTEHWKRFPRFHDLRACLPCANTDELLIASWNEGLYSLRTKSHPFASGSKRPLADGDTQTEAIETGLAPAHGLASAPVHSDPLERKLVPQLTPTPLMPPVLALAQGPDNTYWAANLDGLYKNDGASWQLVLPSPELGSSSWIQTLLQTSPEQLWLVTTTGLFTYQPTRHLLEPIPGLPPSIRTLSTSVGVGLAPTRVGADNPTLWIGTESGLYSLQPTTLQPTPIDIGIANVGITALSRDAHTQTLWVGTEQGLVRLHDQQNSPEHYTTHNSGLAANHITALAHMHTEDGNGRLWIGTPCGLSCFDY